MDKTKPVDIPKGLTSFPDGFTESPLDQNGFSDFYTKVKSAASMVMSNVLQSHKDEKTFDDSVHKDVPLPQSPLLYLPDRNKIRSSQHRKSSPSRAHINLEEVTTAHRTTGDMSMSNQTPLQLSRSGSTNTLLSYSPTNHLPGFATERDNSDTESIMSTTSRDYILPSVDKRLYPLKSGGLSREFWMRDENATECFNCGRPFNSMYIGFKMKLKRKRGTGEDRFFISSFYKMIIMFTIVIYSNQHGDENTTAEYVVKFFVHLVLV